MTPYEQAAEEAIREKFNMIWTRQEFSAWMPLLKEALSKVDADTLARKETIEAVEKIISEYEVYAYIPDLLSEIQKLKQV